MGRRLLSPRRATKSAVFATLSRTAGGGIVRLGGGLTVSSYLEGASSFEFAMLAADS
jgi:hypothetical protein